jgi:predicted tellurium resistance membrane protein TerC
MEKEIDSFLHGIFGETGPLLNTTAGVIVVFVGIILLRMAKKQSSKGKKATAWICIGVGCLTFLIGIVQLRVS